jgi:prevent-host-death family protein
MKIASVAEVKARLSANLQASAEGPVIVTRNGKAVAVLLGVSETRSWSGSSPRIHENYAPSWTRAERRIDEGVGIPHEVFWREIESAHRPEKGNGSSKKGRSKS